MNPNDDRLNYGDILSPPEDYELDFAIGTTYSLDLNTLIGASISLGLSQETDSVLMDDSVFLLHALRNTSDKIALFCENGRIHLPNKPNPSYILLEDMVFEINPPKHDSKEQYFSFHPKFWLLRFKDKNGNILYKLIVLSRNLTFNHSWDITCTMIGEKTDEEIKKNKPISKFIEYLTETLIDNKNEKITQKIEKMNQIMEELGNIDFKLDSDIFDDFNFIINGINENKYYIQNCLLFKEKWDKLFIISPFLSKTVIRGFNERKNKSSKATLITLLSSLRDFEGSDCKNFEVYTLKDKIINGESRISEESQKIYNQNIHAKIYLMEQGEYADLYLGSLNATCSALNGNVEFMIKLRANKNKYNVRKFTKEIFNGKKDGESNPFQLVDIDKIAKVSKDSQEDNFDMIIKELTYLNFEAEVTSNMDKYNIELTVKNYDENKFKGFKIRPLLIESFVDFSRNIKFEKLSKTKLSEFFVISNGKNSKVIKISPIKGMPEDRQEDILSEIIKDEMDFKRYVALLFKVNYNKRSLIKGGGERGNNGGSSVVQLPMLYENMLKTAQVKPEKFDDLEYLINNLAEDIVPDDFKELFNAFKEVIESCQI